MKKKKEIETAESFLQQIQDILNKYWDRFEEDSPLTFHYSAIGEMPARMGIKEFVISHAFNVRATYSFIKRLLQKNAKKFNAKKEKGRWTFSEPKMNKYLESEQCE